MSLFREEMQVKFEDVDLKILLSEYISDMFSCTRERKQGKKETKKLYFVEARPQI